MMIGVAKLYEGYSNLDIVGFFFRRYPGDHCFDTFLYYNMLKNVSKAWQYVLFISILFHPFS